MDSASVHVLAAETGVEKPIDVLIPLIADHEFIVVAVTAGFFVVERDDAHSSQVESVLAATPVVKDNQSGQFSVVEVASTIISDVVVQSAQSIVGSLLTVTVEDTQSDQVPSIVLVWTLRVDVVIVRGAQSAQETTVVVCGSAVELVIVDQSSQGLLEEEETMEAGVEVVGVEVQSSQGADCAGVEVLNALTSVLVLDTESCEGLVEMSFAVSVVVKQAGFAPREQEVTVIVVVEVCGPTTLV